jgi:two-component system nitrate/nitrite response regulator NarL
MRLVLCDDNRILAEALGAALGARGHDVVAITTSLAAGVAAATEHRPDLCLIDLRFPGDESGLAAVNLVRRRCPHTAVVMFSGTADPAVAGEARRLGAAGFLSKDQNVAQVADALDVIASGGAVFESIVPSGPRSARRRAHPLYELTPREREVLRRIVAGQSTGQMSREMKIATSTLRTYVKNLLTKLGTHSRLQAAALASREGLLTELSA